ncbi:ribose-phosphate diphosphokinase [Candidatus Anaplasma sp. TIGMIC]|uniref:ribose-phosphate diphosphokinase n=1 Tax=Candidatus Anaplasma sp. TIGMIC TaxID=3020713 RepID=UPI00232BE5C1|nr:ribose-phosphate diphosphokinase [Candidatus Anaplasma sp. TIGMIC]MDB1135536.1 ribose-phosphate diphosphokinase [Candidatus Anaplasma sp. TIGMIC]
MVVIVPGSASSTLAASLSSAVNAPLVAPTTSRFADGEINLEFPCSAIASDTHVVILQSLCTPANDNLMELLLLVDAVRRARVPGRITAVVPYLCYSRQDRVMRRSDAHGSYVSALSAKVIANMISRSGIDHIVTVDLHSSQATGFFDIPFTSISSHDVFIDYLSGSHLLERLVVVAPDYGALGRVRSFVKALSAKYNVNSIQVAVIDKYREGPGVSEVMHVVGNVKDRHCFILDDIVDSGGTLCNAAAALKTRGAVSVHGFITHGVLSGRALETVETSELDSLVVTDTIACHSEITSSEKVRVLTIAGLLGNYLGSHLG